MMTGGDFFLSVWALSGRVTENSNSCTLKQRSAAQHSGLIYLKKKNLHWNKPWMELIHTTLKASRARLNAGVSNPRSPIECGSPWIRHGPRRTYFSIPFLLKIRKTEIELNSRGRANHAYWSMCQLSAPKSKCLFPYLPNSIIVIRFLIPNPCRTILLLY